MVVVKGVERVGVVRVATARVVAARLVAVMEEEAQVAVWVAAARGVVARVAVRAAVRVAAKAMPRVVAKAMPRVVAVATMSRRRDGGAVLNGPPYRR